MQSHGAKDQRTVDGWADDGATTTFSVRLPRWPLLIRLWGRNPLVRTTDRIEALTTVLAIVVALITVPVALAVGTAVHDLRSDLYAAQEPTRAAVEAVTASVSIWGVAAGVATVLMLITRSVCNRIRCARWQRGLDSLVGQGHEGT
ncbi:hypothetical protein [Mycolicibacterium sp. XJ1819]